MRTNIINLILVFTLVFTGKVSSVFAQSSATEGKEFYLCFTTNDIDNVISVIQIRYVVSSDCYITAQYGDGTYLDSNVLYLPGTYTKPLDKNKAYIDIFWDRPPNNKYLKVTSTEKIGVYGINMASHSTDASTILPVDALGTNYVILSHSYAQPPNTISVIAPTSGTIITIRDANGKAVDSSVSIPAGMVYFYSEWAEITGYTVESNNIVAVFSSVFCGLMATCGNCDHNWEQMWSTNTAGKNYIVWCMSPGDYTTFTNCADNIKIIALEDSTTITRKVGTAITTHTLNKYKTVAHNTPTTSTATTYRNNSSGVVEYTSDKPFIVEHIFGHAPCIKWIAPVEQKVTSAMLSPFVPTGSSVIISHTLHVLIAANAESNMRMKEIRNGVETDVNLTFYTNTTNKDYKIAYKHYAANDSVLISLINTRGFIAYITGHGERESYIITAGAGAYDLQCYFTIEEKSTNNETYYSSTTINTHTFKDVDSIVVKRTIEKSFESVTWLINSVPYSVTENINTVNSLKFPASILNIGQNTITMSVRFTGDESDSVYTGLVWLEANTETVYSCPNLSMTFNSTIPQDGISTYQWLVNGLNVGNVNDLTYTYIPADNDMVTYLQITNMGTLILRSVNTKIYLRADSTHINTHDTVYVLYNTSPELSVETSFIPNPKFRWYDTQTDDNILYEGANYIPPQPLTIPRSYFVSVQNETIIVCENDTGNRKEIKIIIVYERAIIPNMFTPNSDGLNDVWKPFFASCSKQGYQLFIFDRYGSVIFHTTNIEEGWDGTVNGKYSAPNAVYLYKITIKDPEGKQYEYKGHITLVR